MGPTLRIIAFNDVYTLENLPKMASLIAHHRDSDPADTTLVTLAGDFVSPSLLSSLDSGRGMVDCMNDLGVTHVIFGNHEDDISSEELHARVSELSAICLGTNLPGFDPKMRKSDVVEVRARSGRVVRVGLVGTVLTDPSLYRRLPFDGTAIPANEAALEESARLLREENCATVIPLTHQALPDDKALVMAARTPPFPIVIGGHEHELHLEQLEGTWIVKAGSDALHALVIDLRWPTEMPKTGSDFPTVSVRVDDVARYQENAPLRAKVNHHMERVRDLENASLVTLPRGVVLSSIGTRTRQTSMGTLLASRVRDALSADIAIINGGGIRGAREYRERFTYGDLKSEVPFSNELVVAQIPGTVLRDGIVFSRKLAPVPAGGFLQVDDGLVLDEANVIVAHAGMPFDSNRSYRVALVRNLLLVLDHIEPLATFGEEHPEEVPAVGSGREVKLVLIDAFALELWRELGHFSAIDGDQDGQVTMADIAAAITKVSGSPASSITTDLVMRALDTDRDGVISKDEAERATRRSK